MEGAAAGGAVLPLEHVAKAHQRLDSGPGQGEDCPANREGIDQEESVPQFGREEPGVQQQRQENQMTPDVPKSPWQICPLLPGMEMPHVTLTAEDSRVFNLNEAVRQRPAVLVFYRGGW